MPRGWPNTRESQYATSILQATGMMFPVSRATDASSRSSPARVARVFDTTLRAHDGEDEVTSDCGQLFEAMQTREKTLRATARPPDDRVPRPRGNEANRATRPPGKMAGVGRAGLGYRAADWETRRYQALERIGDPSRRCDVVARPPAKATREFGFRSRRGIRDEHRIASGR